MDQIKCIMYFSIAHIICVDLQKHFKIVVYRTVKLQLKDILVFVRIVQLGMVEG